VVTSPPQTELSSALRISVMRLSRRMRQERSGEAGLTATQLAVMATLRRHGALTAGELAAYEKVSPPSMTRVLTTLADAGMVSRRSSPTDGRQVLVDLSETGAQLLAADRRRRDEWLGARLDELTADEQEQLRAVVGLLDRLASQ
jgi:DNA-binding MarR family transcriptional regulator